MTTEADARATEPVGMLALWVSVLGAKLAWLAHLALSYPLVPLVCAGGGELLLHTITVVALLAAAGTGFVAWRAWRRLRLANEPDEPGTPRGRFMAVYGVLSSGLFAITIVAQGLPTFVLDPCM
jgi:hypothetical protein